MINLFSLKLLDGTENAKIQDILKIYILPKIALSKPLCTRNKRTNVWKRFFTLSPEEMPIVKWIMIIKLFVDSLSHVYLTKVIVVSFFDEKCNE